MVKKTFLMNRIHNHLQTYSLVWVFLCIFKLHIWFYYAPPKFKLKEITLSTGCNKKVSPSIVSSIHLQTATFWKWLCALITWKIFSLVWFFYASQNCYLLKIILSTDHMKNVTHQYGFFYTPSNCHLLKMTLSTNFMEKVSH